MAEYKWVGDGMTVPIRLGGVLHQPVVKAIRVHLQDGSRATLNAANQTTGFAQDESLGEIADDRCIRHMDADTKTDTV
jgi:hypothetical protein